MSQQIIGGDRYEEIVLHSSSSLNVESGLSIPEHDYIVLTYVAAGNGAGEIETVTYKLGGSGGTVVAVLTLTYDASNNLSTVTKS